MCLPRLDKNSGFTLLEVMIVLVMISIFAVLALVQHRATDPSILAQAQVLQSHLRYAQMRAMNSNSVWGIHYNHGASPANRFYEIFVDTPGNIATLPGEAERRVNLGEMGITVSSSGDLSPTTDQSFWLSYDSWGQPYFGTGLLPSTTPQTNDPVQLSVSKPGYASVALVVTQRTGFIQ